MSAVFATLKDTEDAALGMLPSLLGGRPAGKVPAGASQLKAGAKKDQKGGEVQPQVLKDVVAPDMPPPGLPQTPSADKLKATEIKEDMGSPTPAEATVHEEVEPQEKGEATSGDSSTDDMSEMEYDDEVDDGEKGSAALPDTTEKTADGLPSVGSALHASGQCSRCCFFLKNRCRNGVNCQFCHLDHERRSRGRGCRGHGTSSKEAKAAEALAQAQQQPPTPSNQPKVPSSPAAQQWPKSMLIESSEPRPTLLPPPPGLGHPPPGLSPPEAIKPVSRVTSGTTTRSPPRPATAPVLSGLSLGSPSGPRPSAPPPFGPPPRIPEDRGEAPPPPENSPGGQQRPPAPTSEAPQPPLLRTPSGADVGRLPPGLGLPENNEARSQVTASQVLLSTSAPPTGMPRLPSVEGCSFASVDGNVTWGQGLLAGNSPAFRPTAGPVTVAANANGASAAAATAVAAAAAATAPGLNPSAGAILGTTPVPGRAMMPWIPGVPRHLMQPGMLQQPVVRTPTAAPPTPVRGGMPTACGRLPLSAPPASAPATPAAWTGMNMAAALAAAAEDARRPQTDDIFEMAALKYAAANQPEARGGKPLKISLPEVDVGASPLDSRLPAKKRLPEWF